MRGPNKEKEEEEQLHRASCATAGEAEGRVTDPVSTTVACLCAPQVVSRGICFLGRIPPTAAGPPSTEFSQW